MVEIVAILMEAGIANLFYITSNQTVSKGMKWKTMKLI